MFTRYNAPNVNPVRKQQLTSCAKNNLKKLPSILNKYNPLSKPAVFSNGVKLFIAIIFNPACELETVKKQLTQKFGQIDFESQLLDFNYTSYYEKEFGTGLKRKFFSFARLMPAQNLAKIKTATNKLEIKFSQNNKRRVNLDPGYLNDAKIILATTKDYSHRIYLNNGIFAELTLIFSGVIFKPLAWTYPDYQSKEYLDIFRQMRDIFMQQRHPAPSGIARVFTNCENA